MKADVFSRQLAIYKKSEKKLTDEYNNKSSIMWDQWKLMRTDEKWESHNRISPGSMISMKACY